MTQPALNFKLKISLMKCLTQAMVLIILTLLISLKISTTYLWLPFVILCLGTYLLRKSSNIVHIAQLDRKIWSVENRHYEIKQLQLESVTGIGVWVFLRFYDDAQHKHLGLCIARDQVSFAKWQQLQQLKQFY